MIELINTTAGVLTFFVIALTAVAALQQLKHLRASNQLAGLLNVLNIQRETMFRECQNFVRIELAQKMESPDFRASLERPSPDLDAHPELWLCGYFEQMGNYVKYDLIGEAAFLDQACDIIIMYWKLLSPTIEIVRRARGPGVFDNFEYLVARAHRWLKKYPNGNYPRNVPHMALYTAEPVAGGRYGTSK